MKAGYSSLYETLRQKMVSESVRILPLRATCPEQRVSHPVDEDDSPGARAGSEEFITAIKQRHHVSDVFIHTALLTEVQFVQTLFFPPAKRILHG